MLLFVAIAMVARHVVRPLTRVIGWPLERLGGTPGRLARENAGRNPARTANTAAALMIGLGLVVFVAVFAQGLKASFVDTFDKAVTADVVAIDDASFQPLPATGVEAMRAVPGVQTRDRRGLRGRARRQGRHDVADRHRRGRVRRRSGGFDWKGDARRLLAQLGTTAAPSSTSSSPSARAWPWATPSR